VSRPGGGLRRLRRSVRRRWKYRPGAIPWLLSLLARGLLAVVARLPEPWVMPLADRCARLAWWSARRRRLGRANVEQALPGIDPRRRDRMVRESCGHLGRRAAEAVVLARRPDRRALYEARVAFEPGAREQLEALRGSASILVTPHLGSVEGLVLGLLTLGLRPTVPMRFPRNYYLDRQLHHARSRWGLELVPRQGAVRHLLRAIRDGRPALLAADQNAHHRPIFVPWFGRPAASERTPAVLALRSGAPLVVCWGWRKPGIEGWRIGCELVRPEAAPVEPEDELVHEWTARLHNSLEQVILRFPEQYLWVHDRYRTRPPAEASPPA